MAIPHPCNARANLLATLSRIYGGLITHIASAARNRVLREVRHWSEPANTITFARFFNVRMVRALVQPQGAPLRSFNWSSRIFMRGLCAAALVAAVGCNG